MNEKKGFLREQLETAAVWRQAISEGAELSQREIDRLAADWREAKAHIAPTEAEEQLGLVDHYGRPTSLFAPRWLCHFLGLRHATVHVLLQWDSPKLGPAYVLQVRSWQKKDYPGHLDVSAAGHIGQDFAHDPLSVAYQEMEEELGVGPQQLVDQRLDYCFGYENYVEHAKNHFYNREWNIVFSGMLRLRSLESIYFQDEEAAGLYLCPEGKLRELHKQKVLPVAPALASYLQHAYGDY